MTDIDKASVLKQVTSLLTKGLRTRTEPFPKTDKEFHALLGEVRQIDPGDLEGKLVAAGFLDHPYGRDQMRCRECTYYLIHRKWCDLPEIGIPVEPDWWCRFWRL